jgi:hemerythrin superfamily protein
MRDHAELIELIRKLVAAFEANARDDMASSWTELEVRLTAHLDAEEKHLFPLLAEREPEYVRVLLAEHARFRRELLDLGVRVDLHTIRMEATNEFIDLLGDHARREDELLYRWADEHATATQRDAVLANIR